MKTYLRILSFAKPYKILILISIITSLIFIVMNSLSIWMIGSLLSTIISGDPPVNIESINSLNNQLKLWTQTLMGTGTQLEQLKRLCISLVIIFLIKNVSLYISQVILSFVQNKMIGNIRKKLFTHIQNLPFSFFDKNKTGEFTSIIINDANVMRQAFLHTLQSLIVEPLNIIIFFILLFIISPKLLFISLIAIPSSVMFIIKLGKSLRRKARRVSLQTAEIINILHEKFSGIRIIKAFAMEKYEIEKFKNQNDRLVSLNYYQGRLHNLNTPINDLIGVSIGSVLLWYGGNEVLSGSSQLNRDDFLKFILLLFASLQHIRKLGGVNATIQSAIASGVRVFNILDATNTIENIKNPKEIKEFKQDIHFDNVSFSYETSNKKILKNISTKISKGDIIAIVGASGSGKSTFIDMIPRFYDVSMGKISIDGINIKNIEINSLRRLIGIVTQDTILFNDTISNNIAYGQKNDDTKIHAAAKAANALGFIEELPDGFNTTIGESGILLSGGQKQRLAIARAIYKDPEILIFDEATSSLDSESERKVQIAIDNLVKDRTVIVIAHRLSTIKNASKIIVLDKGKIIESGTHNSLTEDAGKYKELHDLQIQSREIADK